MYSTFGELAEKMINKDGDVRELARNAFEGRMNKYVPKKTIITSKILMIDEVDTFLSKDFYGATYNPITRVSIREVTEIIDIIWKNQSNTKSQIQASYKGSNAYKSLE